MKQLKRKQGLCMGLILMLALVFSGCGAGGNQPAKVPTKVPTTAATAAPTVEATITPTAEPTQQLPDIGELYQARKKYLWAGTYQLGSGLTFVTRETNIAKPEQLESEEALEQRLYQGEIVPVGMNFTVDFDGNGVREDVWYHYDADQTPSVRENNGDEHTIGYLSMGRYMDDLQFFESKNDSPEIECYLACLGGTNSKQIYLIVRYARDGKPTKLRCYTYFEKFGNEYMLYNEIFSYYGSFGDDARYYEYPGTPLEEYLEVGEAYTTIRIQEDNAEPVLLQLTNVIIDASYNLEGDWTSTTMQLYERGYMPVLLESRDHFLGDEEGKIELFSTREQQLVVYERATTDSDSYLVTATQTQNGNVIRGYVLGQNADGTMIAVVGADSYWFGWVLKK